jgi:hypothetical protein
MRRAGAAGEDVQDKARAIEDGSPKLLLEVTLLSRCQFIIEDHAGIRRLFLDPSLYLRQLAGTDVELAVRPVQPLRKAFYGYNTGGVGQEVQLSQVFLYLLR